MTGSPATDSRFVLPQYYCVMGVFSPRKISLAKCSISYENVKKNFWAYFNKFYITILKLMLMHAVSRLIEMETSLVYYGILELELQRNVTSRQMTHIFLFIVTHVYKEGARAPCPTPWNWRDGAPQYNNQNLPKITLKNIKIALKLKIIENSVFQRGPLSRANSPKPRFFSDVSNSARLDLEDFCIRPSSDVTMTYVSQPQSST